MPTADEVIVEFEAKVGKYEADLRRSAATFERATNQQKTQIKQLERQIEASSSQIGSTLRGLAGAFAAAFSAREVANLADSYTRFTNQLRVAGLEGASLAKAQERLFEVAQQNGIQLEAVGTLYSRAAQNQKELGASTEDLIGLTRAVSASLRISGTSTQEASGALLQLGQALGSPRIQAEEFNSLIDTMQPLLREASKYIDGTGNSLSGLTRKIKDTNGEGVSNVQLFNAITQAMAALEAQAAQTDLTIGAAFTNLTSALTKYIGEADTAHGATGIITNAIQLLADNLGTLAETLAVIAGVMATRYVAAAGAAAAGTLAKAAADVRAAQTATALATAQARLAPLMLGTSAAANAAAASVTRLSVAQGVAARAGGGLIALAGGPWVATILALGAGFMFLRDYTEDVTEATEEYTSKSSQAAEVGQRVEDLALKIATAKGKERAAVLDNARAYQEEIKQKQASALWDLTLARNAEARAKAEAKVARDRSLSVAAQVSNPEGAGMAAAASAAFNKRRVQQAEANAEEAQKAYSALASAAKKIEDTISNPGSIPGVTPVSDTKTSGKKGSSPAGPDAERAEQDLTRLRIEELQARIDLATTAEERAELAAQVLAEEKAARIVEIKANKDLTEAQRKAALATIERLYGPEATSSGDITVGNSLYQQQINRERAAQLEREAQDLAEERYRNEQDLLRNQYDLADSQAERKNLAIAMIDLEERYQRSLLEAIIASEAATEAEKKRAEIALGALGEISAGRRAVASRQNQSPLEAYADRLDRSPDEINEQVESYIVDELQSVQDSLASGIQKAIGTKDPFITGLINLFIEQVIMRPIADALSQARGGGLFGGGGIIGGIVGGLFGGGRAIGGPVRAGTPYMVGENGREVFVPQQAGVVVPNHRLNGDSGPTIVQQYFTLDARGGITTPELLQYVNNTAAQAASRMGAAVGQSVMKSMPKRMASYQRDGT